MRQSHAIWWWILCLISAPWTLSNAYLGYQILTVPASTEEQGLGVIGAEAFLVISIPIYLLFFVLLLCHPKRNRRDQYPQN
jgi:hypothetical protein